MGPSCGILCFVGDARWLIEFDYLKPYGVKATFQSVTERLLAMAEALSGGLCRPPTDDYEIAAVRQGGRGGDSPTKNERIWFTTDVFGAYGADGRGLRILSSRCRARGHYRAASSTQGTAARSRLREVFRQLFDASAHWITDYDRRRTPCSCYAYYAMDARGNVGMFSQV